VELRGQLSLPLCWVRNQNNDLTPSCASFKNIIGLFVKNQTMKTFLFAVILSLTVVTVNAQRYAVIDSKYILGKMTDYTEAQKKLDEFSALWQQELDQKQAAVDKMYREYDAEQVMLPDNLKKKREDELYNKEKELRDLQRKRFGFEGDLFKKRQELIKPIQDRVYNAVQKLAIDKQYDFILDKSEGITVIFADPKLDKSDDVLKNLGVK
jgi:outer membrane protein